MVVSEYRIGDVVVKKIPEFVLQDIAPTTLLPQARPKYSGRAS
jgi:hypothetical protein